MLRSTNDGHIGIEMLFHVLHRDGPRGKKEQLDQHHAPQRDKRRDLQHAQPAPPQAQRRQHEQDKDDQRAGRQYPGCVEGE